MASIFRPYGLVSRAQNRMVMTASLLTLICITSAPAFSSNTTDRASVDYKVKVLTSLATPEIYQTPTGLTVWRTGLPIPEQDSIQIIASVSGGDTITGISTKLDSNDLPHVTMTPWTETIAMTSLSPGDHELDVTTSVDKHDARAKLVLKFNVVQELPKDLVPPVQPVITSVKGSQQLLSQGTIATVDPASSAVLPPVVSSGGQTAGPGVDIVFADNVAENQWKSGQSVSISGYLRAEVVPGTGSADKQFVFSLLRDGTVIYSCNSLLPVDRAAIKLVAQHGSTPGLYPGTVQLYVWGVDSSGNYSRPVVANISVQSN